MVMLEQAPLVEDIQNYAQNIVDTVREPLLILDTTLRVRSANRAFYQTFHVSPEETEDRLIYELGNGQWDIPDLRTLLEDIVPKSSVFDDFELEHTFPVIGRRVMLLNARKLQAGHHGELLVLAMEDVTERRRSEADLKAIETYAQNIVRHGARAAADPRHDLTRPVRQPRLLPNLPRLFRGDREPPDLRAGQRPVGHPRPADAARGRRPQELGLRRLRARAHLPGHRAPGDAAQRPQAPGGPPRRAAGPGDGGRDRARSEEEVVKAKEAAEAANRARAPSWRTCLTRSAPP